MVRIAATEPMTQPNPESARLLERLRKLVVGRPADHRAGVGPVSGLPTAALLMLIGLANGGCSAPDTRIDGLLGVDERDRTAIQVATSRQLQIGYQISSVAAKDDALDFCHEMCGRSSERCVISEDLCAYSRAYPEVAALIGRCRVSRERCRDHRRRIPRQCVCMDSGDD